MAPTKQVYKTPQSGQPLLTVISSGCRTPLLEVKFCNLVKPFYYPNSPTTPRHSVTCVVDPEVHKEFLKIVQTIEKNEKVETILKNESIKDNNELVLTGKILIKFQSKEVIPVYIVNNVTDVNKDNFANEPVPMELEDELAKGEKIMIVYDILRYTKKNTMKTEHGISFKPSCIYYYPKASV